MKKRKYLFDRLYGRWKDNRLKIFEGTDRMEEVDTDNVCRKKIWDRKF